MNNYKNQNSPGHSRGPHPPGGGPMLHPLELMGLEKIWDFSPKKADSVPKTSKRYILQSLCPAQKQKRGFGQIKPTAKKLKKVSFENFIIFYSILCILHNLHINLILFYSIICRRGHVSVDCWCSNLYCCVICLKKRQNESWPRPSSPKGIFFLKISKRKK